MTRLRLAIGVLLLVACGGEGWVYRPRDAATQEAAPDLIGDDVPPHDAPHDAPDDAAPTPNVALLDAVALDAPSDRAEVAPADGPDTLDGAPADGPPLDVGTSDRSDVSADASPDVEASEAPDVLPDASPDVRTSDGPDVSPDASPDVEASSGCGPGETRCGAACVSLRDDVSHCGACGSACAPPFAVGRCEAGRCAVGSCAPGHADCNGSLLDGCEAAVTTPGRCGTCAFACGLGAGAACDAGRCTGPTVAWAARVGACAYVEARDVAVGAGGERAVLGRYRGACSFGAAALTSPGAESGFLAVFGPDGAPRWARSLGADAVLPVGVAPTVGGLLAIAGWSAGRVELGSGSSVGPGGFVVAYDAAGSVRWARTWPAASPARIAPSPDGGACLVGALTATADLGGGLLEPAAPGGAFAACLGADGGHRWSRALASPTIARALAVDPSGGVLVVGAAAGSLGAAAVALSPVGAQLWARVLAAAPARADITAAAPAPGGGAYLAGDGRGSVDFGGASPLEFGARGVLLVALDPGGATRWARALPAADRARSAQATAVAADAAGVAVAGVFEGALDLGGGTLRAAAADRNAVFVAALSPAGAHRWSIRLGQGGNRGPALALDATSATVTGSYGALGFETDAASLPGGDMAGFLTRLSP